ncbi:hypothetical protein PTTG_27212 [Puccinia triticina 1-1 BBBD Race 1]|uniref:Uncharacterized protein n=2 Tax=Puccinia triticina TaxID=208348 RepID=A0A180GLT3_PUCT1|nr:uncharacterized protein PtA15_4A728 [Puccinia triticina]OAV93757.1 hypothetical protein PTTG_27212 [Puccinia triticina 1-1 BBBD Race 1]WAQ84275.1 hypothetical protein PtA15_4A728 [Puccinia triticina]
MTVSTGYIDAYCNTLQHLSSGQAQGSPRVKFMAQKVTPLSWLLYVDVLSSTISVLGASTVQSLEALWRVTEFDCSASRIFPTSDQ